MDAMYRAAMDAPSRVVLSESARRRKDRASAARARSKGYSAGGGLTSTLLDRWWSEATGAPARRLPGQPHETPPTTMRGDQAVAFFNRTGLPTGASPPPLLPADRETHSRAKPRPLVFPPFHSQRSSSPCGSSRSSIAEARPPVCSNRSSRRRAAWCLSRSSRTSPPSTGAPSTRETRQPPCTATRDFANVSDTPQEACTGSSQPSTCRRERTRTPTRTRTTRTIEARAATNTSERSGRLRQPPRRRPRPNRRGSNRRRRRARRLHRLRAHRLYLRVHLARRCSRR